MPKQLCSHSFPLVLLWETIVCKMSSAVTYSLKIKWYPHLLCNSLSNKQHLQRIMLHKEKGKGKKRGGKHETPTNAGWLISLARTACRSALPQRKHTALENQEHGKEMQFCRDHSLPPALGAELDCQHYTHAQTMLSIGAFWGDNCRKHDNGICHPDGAAVSASIVVMKGSFANWKWEWNSAVFLV